MKYNLQFSKEEKEKHMIPNVFGYWIE